MTAHRVLKAPRPWHQAPSSGGSHQQGLLLLRGKGGYRGPRWQLVQLRARPPLLLHPPEMACNAVAQTPLAFVLIVFRDTPGCGSRLGWAPMLDGGEESAGAATDARH